MEIFKTKKKTKLLLSILIVGVLFSTVLKTVYQNKENNSSSILANYEKYNSMSLDQIKKMPKKDRPDLAIYHNFDMVKDPALNVIPSGRALKAFVNIQNSPKLKAASVIKWTERGPNNVGGRTRALMFDPNDKNAKKVWAGAASGGLWYNNDIKSSKSKWNSVNNFWANLAITTITYDPTNKKIFYVGTGEGFLGGSEARGAGIWQTKDGGKTWNQLASTKNEKFHFVQKIEVTSKGVVLAATRYGLYRSEDKGKTWRELYTGSFADLEIASNGDIYTGTLYYGLIFKSTDQGITWKDITPREDGERVEIAVAPNSAKTVYAIVSDINDNIKYFVKSTDGGTKWTNLTIPQYIEQDCKESEDEDFSRGQGWYNLILAVHPTKAKTVILGGIDLYKSTNGGSSWDLISYWTGGCGEYVHADQHAIEFSPKNNNLAIFGNDGGVYYSSNVGNAAKPSFFARNKSYNVTQFHGGDQVNKSGSHIMLAGAQDNGTQRFKKAGVNSTDEVTGGDGSFCHIDQKNGKYQISSYVYNVYYRSIDSGATFEEILDDEESGRFINPTEYDDETKTLYAAGKENQMVRITKIDKKPITTYVKLDLKKSKISFIKASPYTKNRLFIGAGTEGENGSSRIYRVDKANTNKPVIKEISSKGMTKKGYVSSIDVGASDKQIVISYSNYGIKSIWETKNEGLKWVSKDGDMPDIPVRDVLYNPFNRNQLLIATELGVWLCKNLKASKPKWIVTNKGLANVRCSMLKYRSSDNQVMVVTYGRGVYTGKPFKAPKGGDTENDLNENEGSDITVLTNEDNINSEAINIDEVGFEGDIKIYPNPAITEINLEHNFINATYRIYDLAGNKVLQGNVSKGTKQNISIADLNSGVFILRVKHEAGMWTKKFSVK